MSDFSPDNYDSQTRPQIRAPDWKVTFIRRARQPRPHRLEISGIAETCLAPQAIMHRRIFDLPNYSGELICMDIPPEMHTIILRGWVQDRPTLLKWHVPLTNMYSSPVMVFGHATDLDGQITVEANADLLGDQPVIKAGHVLHASGRIDVRLTGPCELSLPHHIPTVRNAQLHPGWPMILRLARREIILHAGPSLRIGRAMPPEVDLHVTACDAEGRPLAYDVYGRRVFPVPGQTTQANISEPISRIHATLAWNARQRCMSVRDGGTAMHSTAYQPSKRGVLRSGLRIGSNPEPLAQVDLLRLLGASPDEHLDLHAVLLTEYFGDHRTLFLAPENPASCHPLLWSPQDSEFHLYVAPGGRLMPAPFPDEADFSIRRSGPSMWLFRQGANFSDSPLCLGSTLSLCEGLLVQVEHVSDQTAKLRLIQVETA